MQFRGVVCHKVVSKGGEDPVSALRSPRLRSSLRCAQYSSTTFCPRMIAPSSLRSRARDSDAPMRSSSAVGVAPGSAPS